MDELSESMLTDDVIKRLLASSIENDEQKGKSADVENDELFSKDEAVSIMAGKSCFPCKADPVPEKCLVVEDLAKHIRMLSVLMTELIERDKNTSAMGRVLADFAVRTQKQYLEWIKQGMVPLQEVKDAYAQGDLAAVPLNALARVGLQDAKKVERVIARLIREHQKWHEDRK